VEHAVRRGRWIYLPFAVACLGLLTPFHLYLGALMLTLYVSGRLFELNRWTFRPSLRICLWLAIVALLGAGLTSAVWLDSAVAIRNSPRGSGLTSHTAKLLSFPVFGLESQSFYLTAILRSFSNDIIGSGSSFRGWNNYLEAPMSYCGLLPLLLLPQVFVT